MFRKMRRQAQQLSTRECTLCLNTATSGVLAILGDEGYPYTVPLSFVAEGEHLYFHSAKSGHKIDCIKNGTKASFCVVAQDNILPEKFTTDYKSVILFGKIAPVCDEHEFEHALVLLCQKYATSDCAKISAEIEKFRAATAVLKLSIEDIKGKRGGAN